MENKSYELDDSIIYRSAALLNAVRTKLINQAYESLLCLAAIEAAEEMGRWP